MTAKSGDAADEGIDGDRVTTTPIAPLARVMERNIASLQERQRREEKESGFDERLADGVTAFAGSLRFVYLHLVVVGFWIHCNVGWIPSFRGSTGRSLYWRPPRPWSRSSFPPLS